MYTIINKHQRIQVFYKEIPDYISPRYESIRNAASTSELSPDIRILISKTQEEVKKNIDQSSISSELDAFRITDLKEFFMQFPHAWEDLKRKLHKYRCFKNNHWQISKADEWEIYSIFLRHWREEDTWSLLKMAIPREIFKNSTLLKYTSASISLLDTSYLDILSLNEDIDKTGFIRTLIWRGIHGNTGSSPQDSNIFNKIFPDLCIYLKKIYAINIDDLGITSQDNLQSLSEKIANHIWTKGSTEDGTWLRSKNAWMIVKAFHAWGGIEQIRELRKNALEAIEKFPSVLEGQWFKLGKVTTSKDAEWNLVYTSNDSHVILEGWIKTPMKISYRVKSLESILMKLWADEDYTTTDAMRDLIWCAISLPENIPDTNKEAVLKKLSRCMANGGYLYKDKWGASRETAKNMWNFFQKTDKKPLSQSKKRDEYSNPNLRNVSFSGFMRIGDSVVGTEIQIYEDSAYEWWKAEHPLYNPRRILNGWSRGQDFVTPGQLIYAFKEKVDPKMASEELYKTIMHQIENWYYVAYTINAGDTQEVVFWIKWSIPKFKERFPTAQEIKETHKNANFAQFIRNLCGVSAPTSPTSSPPPRQGQWGWMDDKTHEILKGVLTSLKSSQSPS